MRASGISYRYLTLPIVSLLAVLAGCSGSRSDRTVHVTQAPVAPSGPAESVPSRLAGGSVDGQGAATAPTANADRPASATASISDAGQTIRQANRIEPAGMIGSEGGVDEAQLMAAFQQSDPQVREIAKRQYQASLARARAMQSSPTTPSPASANDSPPQADLSGFGQAMLTSNDTSLDQGVPTLPGAAQRVAAAQPAVAKLPNDASAAFAMPVDPSATAAKVAKGDADEAPAERVASATRPDAVSSGGTGESHTPPAASRPEPTSKSAEADEETPETFQERFAKLDNDQLFEALLDRYAEGAEDESDATALQRRIRHRLLLTLAGRIDEAVEPLDGLATSEQEYLRHQLLGLWTAIDPQGHPVSQRRWSTALPHLREATSYLGAATGKLEVRSLAFCTEVVDFGWIKPFEVNRFAAGQEVILYSEIDCFAAERLSDGYETHFKGSYEIFNASGKRVADQVLPDDRTSCKNYRRDYFIGYRMHLPSHLEPGSYRLELTLEDLKGEKYGSSSIAFEIEAPAGS